MPSAPHRPSAKAPPARRPPPPRVPSLQWRTPPGGLLPHEPEGAAVSILVALLEWATREGFDFDALLTRAKQTVIERASDPARR
jgi:hypothetical protein